MKACNTCAHRVAIGRNYRNVPVWKRAIGVPLIYLPILTLPFVFASAYLTYLHLRLIGAEDLKTLSDFLPARSTHRYNLKNQITMDPTFKLSPSQSKLYWIFNCTWYCPLSVGLFEWHTYMVKIVENWWCPFGHEKKENYKDGAIDKSFWHIYQNDEDKLNPEDRVNPIWNDEVEKEKSE
ncbi:MAG: hypothetical protein KJ725_05630 [Gammaproteobacteria bacterium]|nr:hypothetical protein [Gammaproteobacteria bacterium]